MGPSTTTGRQRQEEPRRTPRAGPVKRAPRTAPNNAQRKHMPLLGVLVVTMMLVPVAQAGPGPDDEHDVSRVDGFGDHPGNPKVKQDGAACFADIDGREGAYCAVMYGHIFDLLHDVPINVQRPPVGTVDLSRGISGAPTVEQARLDHNQYTFYSSPGFVEYLADKTQEPFLHPERGLTKDVRLLDDVPVRGYFYMSADYDEFTPAGVDRAPDGSDPGVGLAPCLTVHMTIRTLRNYGDGEVIAAGSTTKTIVSAPDQGKATNATDMQHACVDGRTADIMEPGQVTEFEIDMGLAAQDLPRVGGFHVDVDWYQHAPNGADADDKVAMHALNVHTGHEYPNRVVVPYENPVDIEEVQITTFNDEIYLRAVVNSPWGSYDVDPSNVTMAVRGPDNTIIADTKITPEAFGAIRLVAYDVTHAGHFDPVIVLVPWQPERESIEPGRYTVEFAIPNWQHTGQGVGSVELVFDERGEVVEASGFQDDPTTGERRPVVTTIPPPAAPSDDQGIPAAPVPFVLAGLAGASAWLRRRSS